MSETSSLMLQETEQAPTVVAELLSKEQDSFKEIARLFAQKQPAVITTAARGSSDHAATFFKYLTEITTGIPVASIGPSIASVYKTPLRVQNAMHFTVSQSGGSPDIVAMQKAAKDGGALTVAVVNVVDSPLGREADIVLPLHAGTEKSVAATKSYIASVAALCGVTAAISGDKGLKAGLEKLPEALANTKMADYGKAADILFNAKSLYTGGRGTGLAIAMEAALKAKETANIHAEAFSLAELMHGPMRLVEEGFPIVAFMSEDQSKPSNIQALERLASYGGSIVSLSQFDTIGANLPAASTGNALIDPLVSIMNYYRMIEAVTRRKGFDPDKPRNLAKVTETI